jgi:predicted phosphodiesterase
VLVALFADIHANREALEACLQQAREHGAEQQIFLGDYVGYGADPEWVVSTVMDRVDGGSIAVRGNHDNAVADLREDLNLEAQVAMEWTRGELGHSRAAVS